MGSDSINWFNLVTIVWMYQDFLRLFDLSRVWFVLRLYWWQILWSISNLKVKLLKNMELTENLNSHWLFNKRVNCQIQYPNNIKNKCHRIVLIIDPWVCLIANNIKIKYHWFNMNYVECSVAYLHNLHISIYTVDYEYYFIRRLKFLNSSNV